MKNNIMKNSVIYLYLLLAISGCSSQPTQIDNFPKLTAQQALNIDKMDIHLKEWENIKPNLMRLVAIESELNELIQELNGIIENSDINEKQPGSTSLSPIINSKAIKTPITKNTVKNSLQKDEMVSSPQKKTSLPILASSIKNKPINIINNQKPPNNEKSYAIQLYSLSNKAQLTPVWQRLLDKHYEVFKNLSPNFQAITVNNKQFFRLKAGEFSTKEAANKICTKLHAIDVKCHVTLGVGQKLF